MCVVFKCYDLKYARSFETSILRGPVLWNSERRAGWLVSRLWKRWRFPRHDVSKSVLAFLGHCLYEERIREKEGYKQFQMDPNFAHCFERRIWRCQWKITESLSKSFAQTLRETDVTSLAPVFVAREYQVGNKRAEIKAFMEQGRVPMSGMVSGSAMAVGWRRLEDHCKYFTLLEIVGVNWPRSI